jgi:hypothetical protein
MAQIRSLRKLAPGEKLPAIPRDSFNTILDSKTLHAERKLKSENDKKRLGLAVKVPNPEGNTVILVKNDSGSDVNRFGVLGIEEPIVLPSDNENQFAARVALRCIEPSEGESSGSSETDHRGKFVITAEPIANGKIGRAFVAGVCACKLDDVTAEGDFAEIIAGDTEHLQIATTGSAVILWKETASGGQWAIIRFGGGSGGASFSLVRQYTIPIAGDFLLVGNPES